MHREATILTLVSSSERGVDTNLLYVSAATRNAIVCWLQLLWLLPRQLLMLRRRQPSQLQPYRIALVSRSSSRLLQGPCHPEVPRHLPRRPAVLVGVVLKVRILRLSSPKAEARARARVSQRGPRHRRRPKRKPQPHVVLSPKARPRARPRLMPRPRPWRCRRSTAWLKERRRRTHWEAQSSLSAALALGPPALSTSAPSLLRAVALQPGVQGLWRGPAGAGRRQRRRMRK
mmetsp:Transcript_102833/g.329851  ORF Transcript_102833/g.329851 Transcript_102833/m.329851 type:complete len:231 (+) Transcript_102833:339-1031(+)